MTLSGHASPEACLGVFISFTAISFLAVALRLYTRMVVLHRAGLDDILIGGAMIISINQAIGQSYQVSYGIGRDISTLSQEDIEGLLTALYASLILYQSGLHLTKLSILCQYLRIFTFVKFRVWCYSLIAFVLAWGCFACISSLLICIPIPSFWNRSIDGSCLNIFALWFTLAGVNILTDVATAALPLPFFNQLQIPNHQKYALMAVFALGGCVCVISAIRLESLVVFLTTQDVAWNSPLASIWSSIEINLGILCSCLPTIRRPLRSLLSLRFRKDSNNWPGPETFSDHTNLVCGPPCNFEFGKGDANSTELMDVPANDLVQGGTV